MNNQYDIIIIGGGLVGASLALALSNTKVNVLVLEAHSERQFDIADNNIRSIVLAPASQKIFNTLGLWHVIKKHITPVQQVHISDKGHFGVTRITADDHSYEAVGYAISIFALLNVLYAEIKKADNVTFKYQAKVINIQDNYVEITDEKFSAKLIVAADGGQSQVCQLLNINHTTTDYNQSAIVANVSLDRCHKNTAYERFTKHGPVAVIPFGNKRATVVWVSTHQHIAELINLSDENYLQALQEIFGYRAGNFIAVNQRQCYPLNLTVSDSQYRNNVLILGNAAHALHPVSGQGFNLSLRDLAQLVELILEGDDFIVHELLTRYIALRADDQQATINYTNDLVTWFSTKAFPITPVRGLALSKLNNLTALKKIIVKRAAGFRGAASKLLRGISI
jgi:2-octaprenyl-6-methoxyphenol hydroxylase